MANIFQNAYRGFLNDLAFVIAGVINDPRKGALQRNADYYEGAQKKQLKTKEGAYDDNIVENFVGLAIDRSVSMLFGGGIEWQFPDAADEQKEYLKGVWDLNKEQIFLHKMGLKGAAYGTGYIKIRPDELVDPYTETAYPKLTLLNPELLDIHCNPQDEEEVESYEIEYALDGVAYKEVTKHVDQVSDGNTPGVVPAADYEGDIMQTWVVETWENKGGGWKLINSVHWPYNFPPILHWQNLPALKGAYGSSDIDDAINLQDKANFVNSNIGKIIRFHAHPKTIGKGWKASELDTSVEGLWSGIPENGDVFNLEMQSDLASSRAFSQDLRQSIFDLSREVDVSSMKDKVGVLTNFGLRVLWTDSINKNRTKQQLYGDALMELNRRLLVLKGYEGEESRPPTIQWRDSVPTNLKEDIEFDQIAIDMGIIDKETVSMRYKSRYGKSWEDIQKALADQAQTANANNADIGSLILRNFNKGMGEAMNPAIAGPNGTRNNQSSGIN